MINTILLAIWFFLPVGMANTTPIFVAKIPFLKSYTYPLDFRKTYKGIRIFGDHKTFRGLISGIIVGIIVVAIQRSIYMSSASVQSVIRIDYTAINPLILGTLAGLGALLGDAIKSFFKRRRNIQPGKTWFPFDQIDYIIGGILFTLPYVQLTFVEYVVIFILWFILHPLSTVLGYLLKLKDQPI